MPVGTRPVGTVNIPVTTTNVPNGQHTISISGLPAGVIAPGTVTVSNNVFNMTLVITNIAAVGESTLQINLYDAAGNVIFTTNAFTLDITRELDIVVIPQPLPQQIIMRLLIGSAMYTIDGRSYQAEVAPFIDPAYDRTMVPLRLVAERLGAVVNWDEATRTVTIIGNERVLTLQVDTPLPDGMGNPMIVNDRTMVPIAYVATQLGAEVRWEAAARAVYITLDQ